jgi:hypothetical protein
VSSEGLLHRFKWEQDARGRLLVIDFGNSRKDEANALFELFDAMVRAEAPGSVRLLGDFENAYHAPDLTRRWKEASAAHDRQIARAAVTGVKGGVKVAVLAYRLFLRIRGIAVDTKLRLFEDPAAARAWLAEDP